MNELIAIVDDEVDITDLVSLHLKKNGFRSKEFNDAHSLFTYLAHTMPDLVILDLMLPDMDGLEICKRLRKESSTTQIPIIILTAKSDDTDKIIGLELGADDYVTKPFSPKELIARVKAVLRRKQNEVIHKITIGNILHIDLRKYEVTIKNTKIELTTTEFRILKLLAERKGWVYSRDKILDYLWGDEKAVLDRTIDVHVKNLREKLGTAGKFIVNVRGIGYKIQE
ncbi:MAG: two-component system response regulator [Candidatus Fischerbacteria bacterium RBG_13_37_8]|uniref:Two-component system response regulator n=1 Tax=Candidatus Fischerbacteria bacterium RBG_13_37_8 TaxID=1817863 RepID=A0A1F5VXG9_9BACT|nr:MAG: two-component system response regulator [Candidatus Fischerbacteria bacterium RBG_13_37_8]